jgi:hypothetical protein
MTVEGDFSAFGLEMTYLALYALSSLISWVNR